MNYINMLDIFFEYIAYEKLAKFKRDVFTLCTHDLYDIIPLSLPLIPSFVINVSINCHKSCGLFFDSFSILMLYAYHCRWPGVIEFYNRVYCKYRLN